MHRIRRAAYLCGLGVKSEEVPEPYLDRAGQGGAMGSRVPSVTSVDPGVDSAIGLERLTPRQVEVLRLVARGMTNAQVADELFLSRRTVHAHLRDIFRKLKVSHRSAATRWAVQHGLV